MRGRSWLAAPFFVGAGLLVALPAVAALALSLTEYSGIGGARFIGLDNFERLLTDDAFWRSVGNTVIFIGLSVPLRLAAVIVLSLILFERFRGVTFARVGAYLPSVVPDVAYALLWLWLLNPLYGPLAAGLQGVGLTSPEWFTDPWAARLGVVLMSVFQIGEGFVIALAARRALPQHVFEAARVDGAGGWFVLRKVTLPMMAPVLALLALRDVILALQVNFIPALLLTGGGPRYSTTFLPLFVYRQAFGYFRLGYASAVSLTMFVLTAAAVYVQYRLAKRWRLL
jgi:multiple sugar transport system permease protein